MQHCTGLRLLDELADDCALEQHRLVAARPRDLEQRNLAQRRDGFEPLRFGGEIDGDPLEGNALLAERDGRALHIGAQMVTDEGQSGHDCLTPLMPTGRAGLTDADRMSAMIQRLTEYKC